MKTKKPVLTVEEKKTRNAEHKKVIDEKVKNGEKLSFLENNILKIIKKKEKIKK